MKNKIIVEVDAPFEDTEVAMVVIKNFLNINKIKIPTLSIAYDFHCEEMGLYYPTMKGQQYRIFVNPLNCKTSDDIEKNNGKEPFSPGYCADMTLFGITIHEFCHLLQFRIYPNIIEEFIKTFPENRFYLNLYSNNEVVDELAEIMTLYIINPYLLKLISKPHFNFCKSFFKSPTSCTKNRCFNIYHGFPIHVKEHMKIHWGIVYDYENKKFIKN